ncbi:MAG TPA: hypothetical protein PLI09_14565 [Candidatus Hydrogenedentes bacterium]|nr:hypothetical protein [Candidatus Hydrogenedentota bacterium]
MPKKKAIYSNTQSIRQLGEAFAGMANGKVSIPQRDCPDVPKFIQQLQSAQAATRKHTIKFG